MSPVRVLLADDHAVVREGTREILERDPEIQVVGEAGDGPTVVDMARCLTPDVVLLDLALPGFNGIEATRRLAAQPGPRVLLLSAYDDATYVRAAFDAGAAGYLLKTAHADEVVSAIRAVARGDIVLHPGVAGHVIGRAPEVDRARALTARELQILRAAARGRRTSDIASELGVSQRTVEAEFTSIFAKLAVANRTEAVMRAASQGWLDAPGDAP